MCAGSGMYSNLITAAVTLDRARLERLVACGLDHVQVSFQDADPENSNRIGAIKGGFDKKMAVAGWLAELGVPLTVNAPIHRQNIENLEAIIAAGRPARRHPAGSGACPILRLGAAQPRRADPDL